MVKRDLLMLAHKYDPAKSSVNGWFMSHKLDGMRAFWDGGITRGMRADSVPWANTTKDGRYLYPPISTGLWSRYGKVITAPADWLNQLPPYLLDGELYAGVGSFQTTMSITKTLIPDPALWKQIKYMVFDAPTQRQIFQDSVIRANNGISYQMKGAVDWINRQEKEISSPPDNAVLTFQVMVKWLENLLKDNSVAFPHQQTQLPFTRAAAAKEIEKSLDVVVSRGGEGLILRQHTSTWAPGRGKFLLKYKPYEDDEGTVTGYTWGRETDRGSKLLGLMGALVLDYRGQRFELSGFTESERIMSSEGGFDHARSNGTAHPGEEVDPAFHNPTFPRGSVVTFRYRELTDSGLPKEARFLRKRTD